MYMFFACTYSHKNSTAETALLYLHAPEPCSTADSHKALRAAAAQSQVAGKRLGSPKPEKNIIHATCDVIIRKSTKNIVKQI
jgi:hypothetical protein